MKRSAYKRLNDDATLRNGCSYVNSFTRGKNAGGNQKDAQCVIGNSDQPSEQLAPNSSTTPMNMSMSPPGTLPPNSIFSEKLSSNRNSTFSGKPASPGRLAPTSAPSHTMSSMFPVFKIPCLAFMAAIIIVKSWVLTASTW